MASAAGPANNGWRKGKVKAVPSGDTLVIMQIQSVNLGIPREKTITLSSLIAPRLARRDGKDEPFAWNSREYLRQLCIGKEVVFKTDYTIQSIPGREFGTVWLENNNVAVLVVASGWTKVKEPREKVESSPYLKELKTQQEKARKSGVGMWNQARGAAEASKRNLPPSAVGDASGYFNAKEFLDNNKGKPVKAVVEQVRDGSTLRVFLLPEYQFVQVFVAGVQAPSMGRRIVVENKVEPKKTSSIANGKTSSESRAPLSSAQGLSLTSASANEVVADEFASESKYFTEYHVLNRDVDIVVEDVDNFSNLIGTVKYKHGEMDKDLALELVQVGFAKYVEWSAKKLKDSARRQLKSAEIVAKNARLWMWKHYVPPVSNSKEILNQNFTGKVVEVVSGDCIIVADDFSSAEQRVNLSSIRCPRVGRREDNVPPDDRVAKEFLRARLIGNQAKDFLRERLIGRQVHVSMEYSKKVNSAERPGVATNGRAERVMDFGSVFQVTPARNDEDTTPVGNQKREVNVAELLLVRGLGEVVKHRDFEVTSKYYDALLNAESRAKASKKGIHSPEDAPVMNIKDLLSASPKEAREFLTHLKVNTRNTAIVDHVFSGHRFKLYIPKQTCSIAFALSGVRCPGRDEPYTSDAIALMRRKIMQREVEIQVETVDRRGTFLGSLWESNTNVALSLVEAGLARLQTSFRTDKLPDIQLLKQAEQSAKSRKLKIWEEYVEGQEVSNGPNTQRKQKDELKVVVTEVIGGGMFYVRSVADKDMASIQQQLASLKLEKAPEVGTFSPKKGELVLAKFSVDNSWNRAQVVNASQGGVESPKDKFEVFYIDYGNREVVDYSQLRPIDSSLSSSPQDLAKLCRLAYVKVPGLEDDYGPEAATCLNELTLNGQKEFRAVIEGYDTSGGKRQGKGNVRLVTLIDPEADTSINALMLQEGFARLERRRGGPAERRRMMDELQIVQEEARKQRLGMWEYGDYMSDDEDKPPAVKKAGGKR